MFLDVKLLILNHQQQVVPLHVLQGHSQIPQEEFVQHVALLIARLVQCLTVNVLLVIVEPRVHFHV